MGWIKSPACFCAATETARDVAKTLANTSRLTGPQHKFEHFVCDGANWVNLPEDNTQQSHPLLFSIKVYVDDFIALACGGAQRDLRQIGRSMLTAIHSVFPASMSDDNDPISLKKLKQGNGKWEHIKTLLVFQFNGTHHTMRVEPTKQTQ